MAEKPEEKSQASPTGDAGTKKKNRQKKINKMTAVELEDAIKKTQSKMGGSNSRYAAELLKRKKSVAGK